MRSFRRSNRSSILAHIFANALVDTRNPILKPLIQTYVSWTEYDLLFAIYSQQDGKTSEIECHPGGDGVSRLAKYWSHWSSYSLSKTAANWFPHYFALLSHWMKIFVYLFPHILPKQYQLFIYLDFSTFTSHAVVGTFHPRFQNHKGKFFF